MIDLKNTKINCLNEDGTINKELADKYTKDCAKQGVNRVSGKGEPRAFLYCCAMCGNAFSVEYSKDSSLQYFNDAKEKEITLADLEPRVKVKYVKVKFNKLSEAFAEHEKSPLYYSVNDTMCESDNLQFVIAFGEDLLYRKVETEITPMQAAKDACEEFADDNWRSDIDISFESFVKSSDDDFDDDVIKMCRAMVNAYDNKG